MEPAQRIKIISALWNRNVTRSQFLTMTLAERDRFAFENRIWGGHMRDFAKEILAEIPEPAPTTDDSSKPVRLAVIGRDEPEYRITNELPPLPEPPVLGNPFSPIDEGGELSHLDPPAKTGDFFADEVQARVDQNKGNPQP